MKTKLSIAIFFGFFQLAAFGQTEKEAIMKMLKAETESYLTGNVIDWRSYRMQSPEASITWMTNTGYSQLRGWNRVDSVFEGIVKSMHAPAYSLVISDPVVRVSGNLAWADYKQAMSIKTKDTTIVTPSNEMRVLIKDNGKWKILTQVTTFTQVSAPDLENTLNAAGYGLMQAKHIDEAIELFKMNVKLHPNSWNVYDSLGEAYAASGNKTLAIENYETSIRLNPNNDNGKAALKNLGKE
jgi:tetratricopeptide (TPR) repeat protein